MATISAMAGQTTALYNLASRGFSYGQNATTQNNQVSSLTSVMNSGAEYSNLLQEYDATKKKFNTEFSSDMSALSKATDALKSANFNVVGKNDEETAANVKTVVDAVKDFADKYNTASSFLAGNSEVSGRIGSLADSFKDTKYFSQSLSAVGVSVNASTGKLSVDTDRLEKALKESPDQVENALGKSGLAGRTESKVDFAEGQKDKLFPTVNQMMGGDAETTKALYSGRAMSAQMNYINAGNLLNMYF